MSDVSGFFKRSHSVTIPSEKISRIAAERKIQEILRLIYPIATLQPIPERFPHQKEMMKIALQNLGTTIDSRSYKETLRLMKSEELTDYLKFVISAGIVLGINISVPAGGVEVIDDDSGNEIATIVMLVFSRRRQKLTVTEIDNVGDTESITNEYNASDKVSKPANPGEKETTPKNGGRKNYYPQRFPLGFWEINDERNGNGNIEGPSVLKSTASQWVTVYKKKIKVFKERGKTKREEIWEPDGQQEDSGYNIHAGGSNWTTETDGCIRVEQSTILKLKELYYAKGNDKKSPAGKMYLVVEE